MGRRVQRPSSEEGRKGDLWICLERTEKGVKRGGIGERRREGSSTPSPSVLPHIQSEAWHRVGLSKYLLGRLCTVPFPGQFLLRESQRLGRPTNFRLAHRLTLPLPPPDRRLSTQLGHRRRGAGVAGRLWPYPPPPMCGPSGSQRPLGSPALDGT